jgi:hypothetical protein
MRSQTITSRYVHAADAVLLAAADAVADKTAELMGESKPAGDADADAPTVLRSVTKTAVAASF